jgi:hypothetical protein
MSGTLNHMGSSVAGGFQSVTSGDLFSDAYLRDRSDPCIEQRRALAEHGSYFDKKLVMATVAGAATGGLIAAFAGENVLLGAAIGGAVGLAGGYLLKMQQEGMDPDTIIGHAFNNVATENRKIDALLVSFRAVKECRKAEGRAIQRAYDGKAIDKVVAQERMAAVRTRYSQDVAELDEIARQISENTETYAAVYNEIAADNGTGTLEVQDYREGHRSAHVTRRKPQRVSGTPQGSLQASNKQNVEKLQDECLTNVRKRDECIEEIQGSKKDADELELDLA